MNAVYATGWYSTTFEEAARLLGQYTKIVLAGYLLVWDYAERRYVVRDVN
jgi:hypothetical protein